MSVSEPPRLSTIVCNYNQAQFLPQSLDAICSQMDACDDLILVDDASSDNSLEILSAYSNGHTNITLLRNSQNIGPVASANRALASAAGDFITWFGADDGLLPGAFEEVRRAAQAYPDVALISAETILEPAENPTARQAYRFALGTAAPTFIRPDELAAHNRKRYLWLPSLGSFVRRSVLEEMGGWPSELGWLADWFAVYAIALREGALVIPRPLTVHRVVEDSYGHAARHDSRRRNEAIGCFLSLLDDTRFDYLRRRFRRGPLPLSYALGVPLFGQLARRPKDWDLLLVVVAFHIWHNLAERARIYPKRLTAWIAGSCRI